MFITQWLEVHETFHQFNFAYNVTMYNVILRDFALDVLSVPSHSNCFAIVSLTDINITDN